MPPIRGKRLAAVGLDCRRVAAFSTTAILLLIFAIVAPPQASAQSSNCASEAARIQRAETELPRLNVAPPHDKQILCITLETNLLFAKRLSAHLAQCPRSPLAKTGASWARAGREYQALFSRRGCKQTIKGYRG